LRKALQDTAAVAKTNLLHKLKVSSFLTGLESKESRIRGPISKKGPTSGLPEGTFAPAPRQLRMPLQPSKS